MKALALSIIALGASFWLDATVTVFALQAVLLCALRFAIQLQNEQERLRQMAVAARVRNR